MFAFEGTAVRWLASVGPNRGKANVYVDDVLVAEELDLYSEEMAYQVPVFETMLDLGVHTIKVVPTGTKRAEATFAAITVDAFQYIPSLSNRIADAYALLRLAPSVAEVEQKLVSYDYPRSGSVIGPGDIKRIGGERVLRSWQRGADRCFGAPGEGNGQLQGQQDNHCASVALFV